MLKIQGHRGSSENYPENTMLAFAKAVEEGADGIECDVRKSSDGVLLVIHDATVDRTTDGTGTVSNLTWSYISGLDAGSWKGSEFANREDCKVPSLDYFLTEYTGIDVELILHTKVSDIADIEAIVDLVVAKGILSKVIFSSPYINIIKNYNANAVTQNDGMPTISTYDSFLQNAVTNGHEAVSINAGESQSNLQTMVNAIHAEGKLAHASYLSTDYVSGMQKMIDVGMDYVLGNNVEAMKLSLTPTIQKQTGVYVKYNGSLRGVEQKKIKYEGQIRTVT